MKQLPSFPENSSFSQTYIREFLEKTLVQMNDNNLPNKRRRKRKEPIQETPSNENDVENQGVVKTKELKEIITSLLLLEEQEKSEQEGFVKEEEEKKLLFEANHKKTTQVMWDYYSDVQQHHSDIEQLDGVRKRKGRGNSAIACALGATVVEEEKNISSNNKASNNSEKGAPQRRLWVKNRSKAWWDQCNSPDFPEEEFKKAFRMGKDTFELICNELNSVVAKENTMLRDAVPVKQRVAVCIWRLATGEPLRLVSKRFGLGISTCHKLVLEVCTAIRTVLMPKYLQWPDEEKMRNIKDEYEAMSGIPKVVGSMYTTHIPIIAPKISVAAYFNKRHTERNQKTSYSITVQGVVDPRGVFTDVCIGWPGSMPDDQVLEKSALFQRANTGLLNGVWIVGSSGYPLMDWVLVPYTQQHLTWTQHAFNEKIGEVQRIGKEAFVRLKRRWSCLQKRTEVKLQDLPVVLGACCVLHNICEMRNEEMDPELNFELVDDEMVPEIQLRSTTARLARDSIAHNLLHHNHAGTSFLS
ncbi:protein ANTAGONIST OF LIKE HETEROCHROMATIN PROTEIN 1-like [Lycium barbarum]|uniref:protein ANTAGONIST OF LIKE HETEROCHROMATIN PROTEIN 1-like n=1 Tax=Lycium barbarum TaxID=112863 RepID=UPI00293E602E|nr:protein ANTAGONIST OF LIKE HETEROCHROMATIN PROTEIN 1-like [Lycium barbarum]